MHYMEKNAGIFFSKKLSVVVFILVLCSLNVNWISVFANFGMSKLLLW